MPYYLRFLKSPILEHSRSEYQPVAIPRKSKRAENGTKNPGTTLHLTFTCQTDLGDAFYDGDALVAVYLTASSSSETPLAHGLVHWHRGNRVRSDLVMLAWNGEPDLPEDPWIRLEAKYDQTSPKSQRLGSTNAASSASTKSRPNPHCMSKNYLSIQHMPEIINVAAPLLFRHRGSKPRISSDLENHILRQFVISKPGYQGNELSEYSATDRETQIHVYEEIGESIARHIWDAALALIAASMESPTIQKDHITCSTLPHLLEPYLYQSARKAEGSLTILELGSGCGIVGLSLARLVPNTRFILTDLPEALEILNINTSQTIKAGLAHGASITTGVLDWNWALRDDAEIGTTTDEAIVCKLADMNPDLVIVSDCTYNSSSFEALVAILLRVVKQNHQCTRSQEQLKLDVLVSYKYRHESEFQFFEDMRHAGFHILDHRSITFPDRTRASVGVDLEQAEIFAFALQGLTDE